MQLPEEWSGTRKFSMPGGNSYEGILRSLQFEHTSRWQVSKQGFTVVKAAAFTIKMAHSSNNIV